MHMTVLKILKYSIDNNILDHLLDIIVLKCISCAPRWICVFEQLTENAPIQNDTTNYFELIGS